MKTVKTIGLVTAFCVVAVAVAQGIRTAWPPTTGTQVVAEWYSDVPWHQKLGTYAGNQIDEPIVLPYAGLGAPVQQFCKERGMSEEDCMIELGVVNILGMYRIDTPYQNLDAPECKKGLDCIQVTLDLHSFWTRPEGAQIKLLPRAMGSEPQHGYKGVEYGGYVLTDGSVYAPQMPWYMAHYCDAGFPKGALDMQDPVCYADYFSPMNSGFNPMNISLLPEWPRRVAFSPQFTAPAPPTTNNHCAKEDDKGVQLTKCTIALAGFDLSELSPTVAGLQYSKYNNNLLGWFNHALVNFAGHNYQLLNQHKFPWAGTQGMGAPTQLTWEIDIHRRASLNPFLGQFTPRDTEPAKPPHDPPCDVGPNGANYPDCIQTVQQRAFQHVYPRQCKLDDLNGGAPDPATVAKLRQCGLNYEIHHNGFMEQWPKELWDTVIAGNLQANQYGRTSFLFAGVPGMQLPASFYKEPGSDMTDFEKVHNASIFSLFLPMANVADDNPKNTSFMGRISPVKV